MSSVPELKPVQRQNLAADSSYDEKLADGPEFASVLNQEMGNTPGKENTKTSNGTPADSVSDNSEDSKEEERSIKKPESMVDMSNVLLDLLNNNRALQMPESQLQLNVQMIDTSNPSSGPLSSSSTPQLIDSNVQQDTDLQARLNLQQAPDTSAQLLPEGNMNNKKVEPQISQSDVNGLPLIVPAAVLMSEGADNISEEALPKTDSSNKASDYAALINSDSRQPFKSSDNKKPVSAEDFSSLLRNADQETAETPDAQALLSDTDTENHNSNSGNKAKLLQGQAKNTDPGMSAHNEVPDEAQKKLTAEAVKDALGKVENSSQQISRNTDKAEFTSDNSKVTNPSHFTVESAGTAKEPLTVNAPRAAGLTQSLNDIVYMIKGSNKLGVSVNHETFGKLDISVSMEKGSLNVQINAAEKATREFIENNVQSIVDSLAKDGLTVSGFSVSLKDRNSNLEQLVFGPDNTVEELPVEAERPSVPRGLVSVFA